MESFEEVYQKYLKEVYCFLLRLSGDREIAEELTQQTFAIAFEKLENFRGELKISVWRLSYLRLSYIRFFFRLRSNSRSLQRCRQ